MKLNFPRNRFAIRYGHIFTVAVVLKNMILRRTDNCDVQYFEENDS